MKAKVPKVPATLAKLGLKKDKEYLPINPVSPSTAAPIGIVTEAYIAAHLKRFLVSSRQLVFFD